MRIAVMGAGAIGGYYGAVLARGGHDVTFIDRGPQLEAIQKKGLSIESVRAGNFALKPKATGEPAQVGEVDFVLFTVKFYTNPQTIPAIKPMVGASTTVLTVQNGVEGPEQLAAAYGWHRAMGGAAYIDVAVKEPGFIAQTGGPCRIVFGEQGGEETPRARKVLEALTVPGIEPVLSKDIQRDLWTKFIYICGLSGIMCLTRVPMAEVLEYSPTRQLYVQVLREATAVGRAKGVRLDADIVEKTLALVDRNKKEVGSSMQRDLFLGRRMEIGNLNGAVSRMGKELGLPTPVNDVITVAIGLADEQARRKEEAAASR